MIRRVSINLKLALLLILVGVVPLILVGIIAGHLGQSALLQQASSELDDIRQVQKKELQHYFSDCINDVTVLSTNKSVLDSLKGFAEAFEEGGRKVGGPAWDRAEELYGPWLTQFRNQYGYYDLFLITPDGDIVYTVAKEADLGVSLNTSQLKESGLGKLFSQAKRKTTIQDFEPYSPSQYQYAAFVGASIKQQGTLIGVVALQIPHDEINRITNERTGMGETGEAYLVGRVGANNFYRSDRVVKTGNIGQEKPGKYVELALNGSTGSAIKIGSIGHIELVSYAPLEIPGLNWAIMITKDAEEVKQPIYDFQEAILYSAIILIFLLLITSTAISKAAIRPIRNLIEASRSIEEGDLAIQIPVLTKDELGTLSNAFNKMVRSIQKGIAEQKQAEERLRQAATAFENATDGVIITDARGAIVNINQATTKITGYSEEEVLGKNPSIWKSDRHGPSFFQAMWASLEQQDQWRGEIWNRRKNGETFPCRQSISVVRDDGTGEIKHYISIMSDITAIKESQGRLQHLAHHDPLTNLPNRLLFNARLEHAMERAHRKKCGIGVMFLDLDNFKPINDGLGHPVGDKVLQAVAERLTAQIREEDTVARLGGDEYALILEEIEDSQDIAHVAAKILSAFEEPFQIEGQELHVTTSIGISLYPENGKDVTALVKNADAAMYRAKEQGKNRYCFYTLDLTEAALERLQLENDLRVALKRNEFVVYYQPQYSLDTEQLIGAEALVRWQHPKMGLVSPIKFIPLAENTGLIIPIGSWVLREACTQTKAWQDAGLDIGRIGVNVAGQQIQSGDIVQTVREVLEETGLEPQCLELEVTESFIMQQADEAISTLVELQGLGVALAIDDFGTGYSSLSYLKRLPIDKLKIDRSFVKDIPQDADDKAITRAIIALGKSLQLKIIAEGVETQEQKEFLSIEGCDEIQGYYYSRPVSEKDFVELMKSTK